MSPFNRATRLPPAVPHGHRVGAISALRTTCQIVSTNPLVREKRQVHTYRHGIHHRRGHGSRHIGRHHHHHRTEPSRQGEGQCAAWPPEEHSRGREPAWHLLCASANCPEQRRRGGERTVSGEEGDGSAVGAGTASSADTMDVILRVVGVVIVEHMGNVAHIF